MGQTEVGECIILGLASGETGPLLGAILPTEAATKAMPVCRQATAPHLVLVWRIGVPVAVHHNAVVSLRVRKRRQQQVRGKCCCLNSVGWPRTGDVAAPYHQLYNMPAITCTATPHLVDEVGRPRDVVQVGRLPLPLAQLAGVGHKPHVHTRGLRRAGGRGAREGMCIKRNGGREHGSVEVREERPAWLPLTTTLAPACIPPVQATADRTCAKRLTLVSIWLTYSVSFMDAGRWWSSSLYGCGEGASGGSWWYFV